MSEKVGEFLSGLAKDIVNNNIHGYGSKLQEKVDEKIKIFNESASVYTDEERRKYATKKVFNVPTSKLIRTEVNSLKPNATIGIYNDEGNIIRLLN